MKDFLSWILLKIIFWLVVCIMPTPIKMVNQSWTCPQLKQYSSNYHQSSWNCQVIQTWISYLAVKGLIVVSSMLFSMDSSQLVKSDHERKCSGIINDVHHPYSCGEVCIWASKQMVPQSVLVGASFQHSFKYNYTITSFKSHSHVRDDKPRWRYENILQMQRCSSIDAEIHYITNCFWTILPPAMIWMLVLLSITKWLLWLPGMTLMDFTNSSFDYFIAPSWSKYCLFSYPWSTVLPPGGQLFKECREMLMSFL
jgi:hypothetical protein